MPCARLYICINDEVFNYQRAISRKYIIDTDYDSTDHLTENVFLHRWIPRTSRGTQPPLLDLVP